MKLVIDERVKHRLIGLAVILSLGVVFTPAIIKKSNQRFDADMNVSVELPLKPERPRVAAADKKIMFEEVKLAKVEIPDEMTTEELTIAKAKPISNHSSEEAAVAMKSEIVALPLNQETIEPVKSEPMPFELAMVKKALPAKEKIKVVVNKPKATKPTVTPHKKSVAKAPIKQVRNIAINKSGYAVQLATFSKEGNANSLVSKLRSKGYKAKYNKVSTSQGALYKVIVGSLNRREDAMRLQKQLATAVQINGFIVTTGQG